MRVAPVTLISNALLTGGITTAGQQLNQSFGFSIQMNITSSGAVAGTVKLQGSLDDTNWEDLAGSSQVLSSTDPMLYNVTDVMYPWVRLVYTDSGSHASARGTVLLFYRGF
jgi:hypothetical protein